MPISFFLISEIGFEVIKRRLQAHISSEAADLITEIIIEKQKKEKSKSKLRGTKQSELAKQSIKRNTEEKSRYLDCSRNRSESIAASICDREAATEICNIDIGI